MVGGRLVGREGGGNGAIMYRNISCRDLSRRHRDVVAFSRPRQNPEMGHAGSYARGATTGVPWPGISGCRWLLGALQFPVERRDALGNPKYRTRGAPVADLLT